MDFNTSRVFIYMLLKANWKDGKFKGAEIPRGSFVASIASIAQGTGLTVDEVRTSIKHLIASKSITKQSTNKYTVFTVLNYNLHQGVSQANPKQVPSCSQAIPNDRRKEEGKKGRNTPPISPVERFADFAAAYPKKCAGYLAEAEYCNVVAAGVPEGDLVTAAQNYAAACQRKQTPARYIKNPENFLKENLFITYVKGADDGSTDESNDKRDAGAREKSLNELLAERGSSGEFEGF